MPVAKTVPVLAAGGKLLRADLSAGAAKNGLHRFGGALDLRVKSKVKLTLHRVLTISLADPLVDLAMGKLREIPLVYGFVYDGCALNYRVVEDGAIEILKINETKVSGGWPYENFPATFPERKFSFQDKGKITAKQVHSLAWQGIYELDPAKGVAIVPPSAKLGVSLWGEHGDAEEVQVVFEIDPKERTVSAYNQCG